MTYEEVMRLCLERGFFLPSSEIHADAPAGFWEYGPLGVGLRNRFVELWRRELVRQDGMIEIDGALIMSKNVFRASGHLESFVDPVAQCSRCGTVVRADRYLQERTGKVVPERAPPETLDLLLREAGVRCPTCQNELGPVRRFNMMFRVSVGGAGDEAYLRPETAQSIFVDFPRLYKVARLKLPVGIAQFGKSFRNEIAPRQSLLRLREFHQCEIEVFFNPARVEAHNKFQALQDRPIMLEIEGRSEQVTLREGVDRGFLPSPLVGSYLGLLTSFYEHAGVPREATRFRELGEDERAFYAKAAFDLEVKTSLGWLELVACNYRTDYDLAGHARVSGQDLSVMDDDMRVVPHVFELSMGVDRSLYCIFEHAFRHETDRDVLALQPWLAPVQVGVFPLVTRDGLREKARAVFDSLRLDFDATYDESGSIGRRYRRIDEIGTPFAVTVDYDTLKDDTVTLRSRDDMAQMRVPVHQLASLLTERLRPPAAVLESPRT